MPKPKSMLALTMKSRNSRRHFKPAGLIQRGARANVVPGEVDMVAAVGRDFGCVRSEDSRPVREKLASFGRAIDR